MGLFSRRRSTTDTESPSNTELYVFVRCADTSSSTTPGWSLAVSEKIASSSPNHPTDRRERLDRPHKSLSAFTSPNHSTSDFGRQSTAGSISESSSHYSASHPSSSLCEFTVRSGKLAVIEHTDEALSASQPPTITTNPNSLLIKILLPHTIPPKSKSKLKRSLQSQVSLAQQLKHLLQASPSTSPTSPTDTKSWLRTSLLHLQESGHLPTHPSFNVPKFLEFADNHLVAFRTELRSQPHCDQNRVKEVDYAAHQKENERLREMFGHGARAEPPMLVTGVGREAQGWDFRARADGVDGFGFGAGVGSGMERSPGKWWVSYPMAEERGGRGRNVYGGLM